MPRLSKIGAAALAAFGWTGLSSVTASYLVVAGGGGSAVGGGGAGGFLTGTTSLNPTLSYSVTVGAGGSGALAVGGTTTQGGNSVFNSVTSIGGGLGAAYTNPGTVGGNGGSGGGGSVGFNQGTNVAGGTGTVGQGNDGGASLANSAASGGGGGANAAGSISTGAWPSTGLGGAGGNGTASSISGSSVTYAGGGGGGTLGGANSGVSGGTGGGGNSGQTRDSNGFPGTANLGGGGGGANFYTGTPATSGGNGGSGVVIISYVGAQQFGGGVVTSSGGSTIHTFNTSGTLSPLSSLTASYLIVAGGGGGGGNDGNANGGGGAGGLLSGSGITLDTNSIYTVSVGGGGALATNGTGSSFSIVSTATVGGGRGATRTGPAAGTGGSGGGGAEASNTSGGSGTTGQGNAGGTGAANEGGGGGGAGGVGGNAVASTSAGNGGVGLTSSISGTSTYYAGGGGGGGNNPAATGGTGGLGGGGNGGSQATSTVAVAGTANTGGGGGGEASAGVGAAGGSGVVIISYAGSTQLMAGGTVTVAGGNVIHTFTSSGYLTPIVLVTKSLRFRSSASASLSRTPASATNRTTWTWSGWVKRAEITTTERTFFGAGIDGNNFTALAWNNDGLQFQNYTTGTQTITNTTAVFRDPSAWYHIVLAIDTTQATAANRAKIYVNGVQQAGFSGTPFSSSQQFWINFTYGHRIGSRQLASADSFSEQYMTEINFVDGLALTPFSFGTTSDLGVWQPIRYGGSYGTNGFYLPFTATQSFTGIFSGSSQWISVPNLAAYNVGTNNYTVEGWFYITSLGSTQGLWGSNNGSGSTPKFLGLVNTSGAVLLEFTNSGGATFLTSSSGVVTTNKWHHIAWVRNSGTSTIYVNGTAVGSTATSVNLAGLTQAWNIGYVGEAGPSSLTGNASNFRLVTGTAVYTSNFIPQTTPLTAISGTQILTLQNATLVDNSTNAQVVTNNGGVTVGATYPFAMLNDVVKDFGPAGNNWTANNIGETTGSTLDTMTDVPTLTSATTANYSVLNPLNPSGGTYSDGNLKWVSATTDGRFALSTFDITTSGKWYCEVTIGTQSGTYWTVGAMGSPITFNPRMQYRSDGVTNVNGTTGSTFASFTTGDVIGMAFDASTNQITFYKNNTSQGTLTATTTGVSYYFGCGSDNSGSTSTYNINFGQQPFVYTPPTGFVALNTFNLPTPTIGATASSQAGDYFNAVTWTGTGNSGRSITGVGFQPDFVWAKNRTNAYGHVLFDVLRGAGGDKELGSQSTGAEGYASTATYDYLSAFNSDGFTSTWSGSNFAAYFNNSGNNFVAWNWKANGAGVTNTAGSITSTVSASTTAGFSIVTYTANNTAGATIGHGLGVAPSMIIVKCRNNANSWNSYHISLGNTKGINLNSTAAEDTSSNYWNNTTPTSSVFTTGIYTNNSTFNFVAYCFAQVAGYSAFGSYTGNGSSDGTFVFTGFRPRFLIVKRTNDIGSWIMTDSARSTYNVTGELFNANTSGAEFTTSDIKFDYLSNGFKLREVNGAINASGSTYIYMAFCESPFKFSNAR